MNSKITQNKISKNQNKVKIKKPSNKNPTVNTTNDVIRQMICILSSNIN